MRKREKKRIPNAMLGLILAVFIAIASYFAFTKNIPFTGGTEYKAVFASAQNLRVNSPVRIAGVEAGKVTSVEPLTPDQAKDELASASDSENAALANGQSLDSGGALVTMEFDDSALPLKTDATFTLRPRLFLEGNLFVDVHPGSPGAPVMDPNGAPFPPDQTANSVQLDQIFTTAFQADARKDLQTFLDQFGSALIDNGGAQSLQQLARTSAGSFKYTSEVNEAILGENPHDLSGLIRNLDHVVAALDSNEPALQDLIVNLRTVTGSFAAESGNFERAVHLLPQVEQASRPAFANLNAAFPPLRAFARQILPGVKSSPQTLDAATPLLRQLRLLARPQELRGLAHDLVPAVPALASLSRKTPPFLEQARSLASCFNNVIIPWSEDSVSSNDPSYPFPAVGPVYKETGYGLAGIAGESRSQDANGQYIRVEAGGGTNTVTTVGQSGQTLAGLTPFPLLGAMPGPGSSAKTPFKPGAPCENQDPPNLEGDQGPPPAQRVAPADAGASAPGQVGKIVGSTNNILDQYQSYADAYANDPKSTETRKAKKQATKDVKGFYRRFGG